MNLNDKYERELEHLKFLHENLENEISTVMKNRVVDPFEIQKLKKEKLLIKEAIEELKDLFIDDDSAA